MNIKRLAIGLLAGLALVSCGTKVIYVGTPTTVVDTIVATSTTTTTTTFDPHSMFVRFVRSNITPGAMYVSDQDLISAGDLTCQVLGSGGSSDQIISAIIASFPNEADRVFMAKVTGAAIAALCPQYKGR